VVNLTPGRENRVSQPAWWRFRGAILGLMRL